MARALIVGMGGLGCSAAPELAGAGIELTLCDFDVIEQRNLGRQDLYAAADVGKAKVDVAAAKLSRAHAINEPFRPEFLEGHEVVLDCTDEPGTRALIHQTCLQQGVPLVWAGVANDEGQWAVVVPGKGPCLRCLWPGVGEPQPCDANTDAEALRAAGRAQGMAAVRLLEGANESGVIHLLGTKPIDVNFARRADCVACGNL